MSRRIRYSELENRTARDRLRIGKAHWRALAPGRLSLGYRRLKKAVPGHWLKRVYVGTDDRGIGHYKQNVIAVADDFGEADGTNILNFEQAQVRARDEKEQPGGALTVQEAVTAYIAFLRARGQKTDDTERRAAAHIVPRLGSRQVEKLTSAEIRSWLAELAGGPALVRSKRDGIRKFKIAALDDPEVMRRRRSSANRVLTILKAALNHAYDEGAASSVEAWGRRVKPFRAVDAARVRYLTVAEAQRLINGSQPDFRLLVRAALETGARYSELTRLVVCDFNPDAGTLHIRQSKSGKERHIVLTEDGIAFIREVAAGLSGQTLIFRRADSSGWKASQQARPMAEANDRAKIDPPVTFHALRHTYASHCVMNGVPLMVVAQNLGHADVAMIQKHYAHLAPSHVSDAIRAGAPRYAIETKGKVTVLRER
jgi:integrase